MQRKFLLVTVLIIIMATCALWSATNEKPNPDPKTVIVEFDKGRILKGDLDARIDKIPPNYQNRYKTIDGQKEILQGLILEDVFYRKALEIGVDKDPVIVEKTDNATRELYIASYYRQYVQEKVSVTDKDRQKYYMGNLDEFYEMPKTTILYLQTKSFEDAEKALAELNGGAKWADVSTSYNTNGYSKNNKGVIKGIRSNGYIPGLNQNEFLNNLVNESAVSETAIYGPEEHEGDFHLYMVTDRVEGYQKGFEDAASTIDTKVYQNIEREFNKKLIEKLMKKYDVVINHEIADSLDLATLPTDTDLFQQVVISSTYPKLNFTVETLYEMFNKLGAQEKSMYMKARGEDSFFVRYPTQLLYMAEVDEMGRENFVDEPDRLRQIERYFILREIYKQLVSDHVVVEDKDINSYYQENLERYKVPGYRSIRMFKFDDEKSAKKGRKAAIKATKKNAEKRDAAIKKAYAKYASNSYDDGFIEKIYDNKIIFGYGRDEAFSKLIFETNQDATTDVFTAKNGDILCLTVENIVEDTYRPMDEVKATIEKSAKQNLETTLRDEVKAALMVDYGYKVYDDRLTIKLTVEELFEMADNAIKQRKYNDAVIYYDQIIKSYADGVNDYKAMFMKGFTYSENMKDTDSAVKCFNELIVKYPKGELNDSAIFMLDQIENGEVNIDELIGDN